MKTPTETLLEMGFAHLPMEEHFGKEKDVPGRMHYLYRKYENNHQYVSVMYDYEGNVFIKDNPKWGKFLEAVFESYWVPKNVKKAKVLPTVREMQLKGYATVFGTIFRNTEALVEAVSKEYQLSPEKEKTS